MTSPSETNAGTPFGWRSRPECPACGATHFDEVANHRFEHAPMRQVIERAYQGRLPVDRLAEGCYELVRCRQCTLLYQRSVLDDSALAELYGEIVGPMANAHSTAVRLEYVQQLADHIAFADDPADGIDLLDFGSGAGALLDVAAALGCTTTGAEMSSELRAACRKRGHRMVPYDDLPTSSFDMINAEQVLEHVTDPSEVMVRIAEALRPGAIVRIGVPDGSRVVASIEAEAWNLPKSDPRSLNPVAPLEHINCFNSTSLEQLGRAAGLESFTWPARVRFRTTATFASIARSIIPHHRSRVGLTRLFRRPGP